MDFAYKPDYEESHARYMAFWEREIIDRPPVCIRLPKEDLGPRRPSRPYASYEEQWLDLDGRVDDMDYDLSRTDFLYDALPVAWPNLGPEIFSAWCGCGYKYGPQTTWSVPCVEDWESDFSKARIDFNHPLFKKMVEFTQKLLERGKGKFIVGLTDFHPGGDHVAALRDPQQLCLDLLEEPEWVKRELQRAAPEFFAAYGVFYNMIHSAGMPTTSWTNMINDDTYYIPSNDFSCMISNKMFEEFFLPGLAQECAFYDRSLYHLDGPGALKHLDSILSLRDLDVVQFVCGAGNEGYHKWVEVYQKIQRAGKGIEMHCSIKELDMIFETIRPEGVWFSSVSGVRSREDAEYVVKRITAWK